MAEFMFRWDEQTAKADFADCKVCEFRDTCSTRTTYRTPPLKSSLWPACPVWLHSQPDWQAAARAYSASRVAPLSGWPGEFCAWGTEALIALHAEDQAAQVRAMEAARSAPKGGASANLPPHSQNRRAPRSARVGG